LNLLEEWAAHRYGIFVLDYNSDVEKHAIMQAANIALEQNKLTFDAWFVVTQTSDPKLAAKIISYKEYKAQKKARAQQIQDKQIEDKISDNQFQRDLKLIQEKNKGEIEKAQIQLEAAKYTADQNKDAKIITKDMTIKHEPEKNAAKTAGAQEVAETKENLKHQEPFPA
jgi:hypothetical protein